MEGIEKRYWEKLQTSPLRLLLWRTSLSSLSSRVLDKKGEGLGNGPRLTGSLIVAARSLPPFKRVRLGGALFKASLNFARSLRLFCASLVSDLDIWT